MYNPITFLGGEVSSQLEKESVMSKNKTYWPCPALEYVSLDSKFKFQTLL